MGVARTQAAPRVARVPGAGREGYRSPAPAMSARPSRKQSGQGRIPTAHRSRPPAWDTAAVHRALHNACLDPVVLSRQRSAPPGQTPGRSLQAEARSADVHPPPRNARSGIAAGAPRKAQTIVKGFGQTQQGKGHQPMCDVGHPAPENVRGSTAIALRMRAGNACGPAPTARSERARAACDGPLPPSHHHTITPCRRPRGRCGNPSAACRSTCGRPGGTRSARQIRPPPRCRRWSAACPAAR